MNATHNIVFFIPFSVVLRRGDANIPVALSEFYMNVYDMERVKRPSRAWAIGPRGANKKPSCGRARSNAAARLFNDSVQQSLAARHEASPDLRFVRL